MAELTSAQQLPLQVSLPDDARLDVLYAGPNAWFFDWLKTNWSAGLGSQGAPGSDDTRSVVIQAPPGGGLTYLLQAICRQGEDLGVPVFYLSLADLADYEPDVLEGMADLPLLCLDDADRVLGQPQWDEALFHLFNALRDRGHHLVLGSHSSLADLEATVLPDLYSRLTWGLRVSLKWPEDEAGWAEAVQALADQRGLQVSPDTAHYLALRGPRDWQGMSSLIARLDTQALAAKRRITQPFIREVTGW